MSDTQLYIVIGVPGFLVVLAWVTNMIQVSRLDAKLERLSDKIDRTSHKIDRVSEQLSAKMDRVAEQQSAKMDRLTEQQHKDAMTLQSYMIPLHERMALLEAKQK